MATSKALQDVVASRIIDDGRVVVEENAKKLERLVVEYVPPGSLLPNRYNPNRQSTYEFEKLCRSMEDDGFTQPVIVNQDGIIVDGEHRWRAAIVLDLPEMPIVRVEMSKEQMMISTLRHNRGRGRHDVGLEATVVKDLMTMGVGVEMQDALMLSDVEMQRLTEDMAQDDAFPSLEGIDDPLQRAQIIEQARQRQNELEVARQQEITQMIVDDPRPYRVVFNFSGEEGQLIKQVLGKDRAVSVLRLCEKYKGVYVG